MACCISRTELMQLQVIREMTDGGVDYSFECTGINGVLRESFLSTHDVCCLCFYLCIYLFCILSLWKSCMRMCMQGWGLTVVLGIHATPKMLPLHPMELFDGRRITGCVFGDMKGKSQLPGIVDKCMNGVCLLHLLLLNCRSTFYCIFLHFLYLSSLTGNNDIFRSLKNIICVNEKVPN